jgi:hypothetical protein
MHGEHNVKVRYVCPVLTKTAEFLIKLHNIKLREYLYRLSSCYMHTDGL